MEGRIETEICQRCLNYLVYLTGVWNIPDSLRWTHNLPSFWAMQLSGTHGQNKAPHESTLSSFFRSTFPQLNVHHLYSPVIRAFLWACWAPCIESKTSWKTVSARHTMGHPSLRNRLSKTICFPTNESQRQWKNHTSLLALDKLTWLH